MAIKKHINVTLSDYDLVLNSRLNKGSAFTEQEREIFNLFGILPPRVGNINKQRARSYRAFSSKATDLEKYLYLRDLQDSNETLFFNLLNHHISEMMPIIYTPTVGLGCQRYSQIYRRPRGLFISYPYKNRIDQILANPKFDKVKVIVVSDGERILGLGDQGAGGMGIPIGKLALYVACAGIAPEETLPILLDTGTNNQTLADDPLYMGWAHSRIRGKEYSDFIDKFVTAVKKRFPGVLLQWEDFAQQNATAILERYSDQLCTFNDDIQGTAAVAVATFVTAVQSIGNKLADQKIVIVGAGSAGCGISKLMMQTLVEDGLSVTEAKSRFFLVDRNGLLIDENYELQSFQKPWVKIKSDIEHWKYKDNNHITLEEVVKNCRPSVLIGVSGQANIFTKKIVKTMAKHAARPIIFPLSNPTANSEATPSNLLKWTGNRAIISTGSPFAKVRKNGKFFKIDQTNNCYIFPGVGLGIIAVQAKRVTNKMLMAAAKALADCSPAKNNSEANLLPELDDIREVSFHVAVAVAKEAISSGDAKFNKEQNLKKNIANTMWQSEYLPYKRSEKL